MHRGCVLAITIAFLFASTSVDQHSSEKSRLKGLHKTAAEIHKIILKKDIPALLNYVEQDERDHSWFDRVKRDLYDAESFLYGRLFDTTVLNRHVKRQPTVISVREYFVRATKLGIDVSSLGEGEEKYKWGHVVYYSANFRKCDWPTATFYYSDGKWWIRNLFEGDF